MKFSKRALDYLFISLILILFLAGLFLTLTYFQKQRNECINNPLVYGAKQMSKEVGYEFVGTGFFILPVNYKSPRIMFNSTSIKTEK